jgi:hypothetical protein
MDVLPCAKRPAYLLVTKLNVLKKVSMSEVPSKREGAEEW